MNTKEFAQEAIKNGHGSGLCNGWDWIRNNISELDYIFQTEEYKQAQVYKTVKVEILTRGFDLTDEEINAIGTAWYLNNERETRRKQKEHREKMITEGWEPLTEEIVKKAYENKKKIKLNASMTSDWITVEIEKIYKPFYSGNFIGLMKPRARNRGYSINQFDNAFCKVI